MSISRSRKYRTTPSTIPRAIEVRRDKRRRKWGMSNYKSSNYKRSTKALDEEELPHAALDQTTTGVVAKTSV